MIAPNAIVGGRYRIVRMLGGGGMKLAYAAEDLRLGARLCALAEMVDGFTSQEAQRKAVDAFQREADILAQLSNQHIPQVFDCFSEANHHYLVMEFIDGTTLENELTRSDGKLPADRVLEVALEVLEALRYLHARRPPLIHRDLKPSNLMTTTDGRLKLIDFGIARHFVANTRVTMVGTHGYAPPEQYAGRPEPRSDLYSLAATIYQALSGRDPTTEAPFRFPPLRNYCPDLNPKLVAAIERALAYEIGNRPHDAESFRQQLLACRAHPFQSLSASSPSTAASFAMTPTLIYAEHEPTDQWTGARYPRRHRRGLSWSGVK
jgi:eukaryotic-like serine/threonine-protein kinase